MKKRDVFGPRYCTATRHDATADTQSPVQAHQRVNLKELPYVMHALRAEFGRRTGLVSQVTRVLASANPRRTAVGAYLAANVNGWMMSMAALILTELDLVDTYTRQIATNDFTHSLWVFQAIDECM